MKIDPTHTLVRRVIPIVLALSVATCISAIATPRVGAAPEAHATTPNPTVGTYDGKTVTVQASPEGLTACWSGYDGTSKIYQSIEYSVGANFSGSGGPTDTYAFPPPTNQMAYCYFISLPDNEYSGNASIETHDSGFGYVLFDLVVSPSDPPPPSTVGSAPVIGIAANPAGQGFWTDAVDGGVHAYNGATNFGSMAGHTLNKGLVAMAATSDGQGYYLVGGDGGIFSFGDAQFYGSTGNLALNKPVNGMAVTQDGKGYWLVASDGGIFSFGDAPFLGSMGATHLNQPVVGMASYGGGYTLVASDGGVFNFGTPFYGSLGSVHLNAPIVGIAPTPDGKGYWMVASDGGIFAFGDAGFFGAAVGSAKAITGIAPTPDGRGYWLAASDGTVLNYGDAATPS